MKNTHKAQLLLFIFLLVVSAGEAQVTKRIDYVFRITVNDINTTEPVSLNTRISYTDSTTNLNNADQALFYFRNGNNPSQGRLSLYYNRNKGQLFLDIMPNDNVHNKKSIYNLFYTKASLKNGSNVLKISFEDSLIWVTCNAGTTEAELIDNNGTGEGVLWDNDLSLFSDTTHLARYNITHPLAVHTFTTGRRLSDSYFDDPVYDEYGYGYDDVTQPLSLGNGLSFDGANDYVSVPSSASLSFGTGNFSLEAWVKFTANAGSRVVAGRFNGSGNDYWLGVDGNKAHFSINGAGLSGSKSINDGSWHHIAGVRNAGVLSLFVDGMPDAANVANANTANPGGAFNIGAFNGGYNFSGVIDEVRVWNISRSQADIQSDMNFELEGNETGLVAYYNFDQGTACGTNTGITSLPDITGHSNTGTLTNLALTGTTSNWVPGVTPPSYDTICVSDVTQLDNYADGGVWSSSNAGIATVSSNGLVTGMSAGTAAINYTVTNTNGCTVVSSTFVTVNALPSAAIIAGNGLHFDGINDHVAIFTNTNIPIGNSSYSIEAWIKPNVHTYAGIIGWGNWGTTNQTNSFRLGDNNTVRNGWYNTELSVPSGNLADGLWHHVAATFDGTTRKIYVDGVLKGQDNPTGHNVPFSNNLKIGTIGTAAIGNVQNFTGSMDEVRVWNVARSQADIQAAMYTELTGNETGLAAHYNFNSGTASAGNTATILADKTSNNNTGTLTNFALTGATSNWVDGADVSLRSSLSNGLAFDGTNDYVSVPTSKNIPAGNSNYTLEAWIKPNVHATNGIIGWGDWWGNNKTNALRLGANNAVHNYWWGNDLIVTSGNLADGAWHHVAATFDGTTRKIYVDGVLKGQDNPTGHNVTNTGNIAIGRTYENEYFNGKIDEVRVWNIARSQTEIQSAMYTELSGTETGLASYYGFNNGVAEDVNTGKTILSDKTASINSGILNNFALNGTTSNWVSGSLANTGTMICAGSTIQLNNASLSGTWSSSDIGVATVSSTGLVSGISAGTATITYTNTNTSGCYASSAVTINVNQLTKPVVTATSTSICTGTNAVLSTAQVAGYTYKWATTPNGTSIGSQPTLTVSPASATTYYVTVSDNSGCLATSDGTTINVSASTMAAMAASTGAKQITVGPTGRIYAILSDDRIYKWNGSGWTRFSNNIYASSMAIQSNGNMWFVASGSTPNEVYFIACDANGMPTGNSTEFYQSSALKVACGANNTVAIIGTDYNVWKWNGNVGASGNSASFTRYLYTSASDIAVDASGRIWYVDRTYHGSSYLSGSQWVTLTGYACNQIACGMDGSVFVTGWGNNSIYKWNGSTAYNIESALGTANTDLAVYNASMVVKLDNSLVYKPECFSAGQKPASNDPDNEPFVGNNSYKGSQQLRVYPNPNKGSFTVAYTLQNASSVILRLVDVQGRVVYEEVKEKTAGNYACELSLQNLSAGVYFLKISTPQFSRTETVSIQK